MRFPVVAGFFAFAIACSSSDRDATIPAKPGAGTDGGGSNPDGQDPGPITGPVGEGGVVTGQCVPDPANFDQPGNGCDDDGDGKIDNPMPSCDASLPVTGDAEQFAHALGLCQKASGGSWGIVSASYRRGYNETKGPADGQHGILPTFGPVVKPREGDAFGVLSTGWARVFDDASGTSVAFKDGKAMQSNFTLFGPKAPPGFPKSATGCPSIPLAGDISVLRLEIKVPKNAQGLQFDFDFYSGEWPEWVCSTYNDSFIAYLKSAAFNGGQPDNISFDAKGNPVSINNAFLDRCTSNTPTGCKSSTSGTPTGSSVCPGGESEITGTGFEKRGAYCTDVESVGGAATGWLTSQAPVQPGETITLEFYIWDGTDARFDSSVLLDNFRWVPTPVVASTTRPPK